MATPKCDGCGACQNEGKMDSINCRLCGGATYCNEQCASEAWSAHASECNLHTVPTVNTLVAMPYGFQDLLEASYQSENHLTQHVNQAGLISSRVLAFSTPHLVAAQEAPAKWVITVNGVEATAVASGKNDCITAKAPGKAGKLASQRSPSAGTTLWTPLAAPIAVTAQEKLTVALVDKTTGKAVTSIDFQLPPALDVDVFADMSRKERGLIQSQLAEKKTSLAAVTPYVVQDERSTVRLLIDKSDNLVDIEYQLCGATLPEWNTQRFQCDSRDIDHVSGLLMAVSDRIESLQFAGQEVSALKNDYNTIYGHYTALHDNLETEPSASVNAAIHRCTQAQFAEIGGFWSSVTEGKKLITNRNDPEKLLLQLESYVAEAEDPTNIRWWRMQLQLAKAAESRLSTLKQNLNTTPGAWKPDYTSRLQALRVRMEDVRRTAPARTKGQAKRRVQGAKAGFAEQKEASEADKTRVKYNDPRLAPPAPMREEPVVTNMAKSGARVK